MTTVKYTVLLGRDPALTEPLARDYILRLLVAEWTRVEAAGARRRTPVKWDRDGDVVSGSFAWR